MARETKEDRIVKNNIIQVTEHLLDFKTLDTNPSTKEMEIERWAHSFLRSCLGFNATSGYSIRAQETKGKSRPDLIILKNEKPVIVVEVKRLGFDLSKSDFRSGKLQLSEYLNLIGNVRWGILTNGQEWHLYDFFATGCNGLEIAYFDIKSDSDVIDTSKRAVEEFCYDILDLHESSFESDYWSDLSKESMAFSPESLAKAVLSHNVIKHISRAIKGEHEYKACQELLTDKVYSLLELGLNDAISGWNEAKDTEFKRYIRGQKRASRKSSPRKKDAKSTPTLSLVDEESQNNIAINKQ